MGPCISASGEIYISCWLLLPNMPIRGLAKPLPSSQPCSTVTHFTRTQKGQNPQSTILPPDEPSRKLIRHRYYQCQRRRPAQPIIGASSASDLSSRLLPQHVSPLGTILLPTHSSNFYIYPHTNSHTGPLSKPA